MLKNWTVTTQVVKDGTAGVMRRERYLLSASHPNHKNTECIINILGNQDTSQRIALSGEEFRVRQILNKKGGRPLQTYAMEFCLTLPQGYRPDKDQWRQIVKDICIGLSKQLSLSESEFKDFKARIRAVLHRQKQFHRSGSGDHVHLVITKVVGKRILKELQRKQATRYIKQLFSMSVLKHTGFDYREYSPRSKRRSKRLDEWQYQQQEAKVALRIQQVVKKLRLQSDKWFEAFKEGNDRQIRRQWNRLIKSFAELEELTLEEEVQNELISLKESIESLSGSKLT